MDADELSTLHDAADGALAAVRVLPHHHGADVAPGLLGSLELVIHPASLEGWRGVDDRLSTAGSAGAVSVS
ncbi:hypothetical protein [Microbacterium maritypicum]|uniref:hypothetical protein n=1 Tax=Microbacterium maritypicum TaxID=33918 RepID=UPI003A954CAF